uniref:Uncharacterized protein n=1 Tax=Lates calcarifer TaxID=8187 RepID=A0A4W6FEQ6_LATCA
KISVSRYCDYSSSRSRLTFYGWTTPTTSCYHECITAERRKSKRQISLSPLSDNLLYLSNYCNTMRVIYHVLGLLQGQTQTTRLHRP